MNNKKVRVLLTLVSMCFITISTLQAQSKPKDSKIINYTTYALVSNYASNQNKNISIRLIVSNDSSNIYYVVVKPTRNYPKLMSDRDPFFYFEFSDTLSTTLQKVVEKFREWHKIAIEHQTAELVKDIDIEIPIKYMSMRNYTNKNFKWSDPSKKKFTFVMRDLNAGPNLCLTEEIKAVDINQITYLILSAEDLENIANLLDYQTIMKRLKTESVDVLFK